MSLRIRQDGRILCAAMHPEEPGDTYLHDGISYRLTVEHRVIVTEAMEQASGRGGHAKHGEWWWKGEQPADVVLEGETRGGGMRDRKCDCTYDTPCQAHLEVPMTEQPTEIARHQPCTKAPGLAGCVKCRPDAHHCTECSGSWPCLVSRLAAEVDALKRERDAMSLGCEIALEDKSAALQRGRALAEALRIARAAIDTMEDDALDVSSFGDGSGYPIKAEVLATIDSALAVAGEKP